MSSLEILKLMKAQYDKDVIDRTVYGEELVSSDQLMGERRMIVLVQNLIDKELSKMAEDIYDI